MFDLSRRLCPLTRGAPHPPGISRMLHRIGSNQTVKSWQLPGFFSPAALWWKESLETCSDVVPSDGNNSPSLHSGLAYSYSVPGTLFQARALIKGSSRFNSCIFSPPSSSPHSHTHVTLGLSGILKFIVYSQVTLLLYEAPSTGKKKTLRALGLSTGARLFQAVEEQNLAMVANILNRRRAYGTSYSE